MAAICGSLSHEHVLGFFDRWMGALPSPFTAAERRRHPYRLSVRQIEMSDTRVFDPPAAARGWFEQTIRDQLDIGRPDKIQIVFARTITKRTPGRFQTKVIHRGVEPVLQAHYKHSKVKQYLKDGCALRTETTVNDPYDFSIKRTLSAETWQQLTGLGEQVNERLMAHELAARPCAPDPAALQAVVLPSLIDGQPAPALRFGDPRVMALLACLCAWQHLFAGLTNRSLHALVAGLIAGYTPRQATYDLCRLRRNGLIRKVGRSRRYELTDHGRMIAVFFTKTHTRIVNPALAELDPRLPDKIARSAPLGKPWREFDRARRSDQTGRYRGLIQKRPSRELLNDLAELAWSELVIIDCRGSVAAEAVTRPRPFRTRWLAAPRQRHLADRRGYVMCLQAAFVKIGR